MTPTTNVLAQLQEFGDITRAREPLAPFTLLRVGGPAEAVVRPRTVAELQAVLKRCFAARLPLRVLGGGGNLLVSDEGVAGVVLRLDAPPFTQVQVEGRRVRAGCGATLTGLIAQAAQHNLAGLETLVGLPGTVGGALFLNAGDRSSEIGQYVRQVEVLDAQATVQVRDHDDLRFTSDGSNLDDPVLLSADFELEPDQPDAIVKRLRKTWIQRKATQPYSYQHAGRMFKNPPGLSAAGLIEQAELVGTKVGGAHVDDRNANYVVAEPGTSARDVLRLLDLVRTRVEERFHVELELSISVSVRERQAMPKPAAKSRKTVPPPAPTPGAAARRWLLKGTLLLLAVAGFLAGIIWLGRLGMDALRDHERYLVPVAEIECVPPPGLERAEFLEQVRYYAALPERVSLLDDALTSKLRAAFAEHPWVEKVDEVKIAPPRQIRVVLTFRRPVLAVAWGDGMRAIDADGVLLPKTAPTRGLPVYPDIPAPPRGREGKRWGDPNLEQAAHKLRK